MSVTYDSKKVNLIVNYSGGTHAITGFAEGSEIAIARNSEAYTQHKGIKGDVDFAETNDNSGTITITLKHTSASNRVLTEIFNNREQFDCYVVDGNDFSKTKDGGSDCVIQKPADKSFGAEIGEREWVIAVPNLTME